MSASAPGDRQCFPSDNANRNLTYLKSQAGHLNFPSLCPVASILASYKVYISCQPYSEPFVVMLYQVEGSE